MKVNLVPHLCWLISILIAIIAFLILRVTNGNEVNSYISFASSIASLILAVVAIFYSIISNDSLSNNFESIRNLGSTVQKHTDNLDQAASKFVMKIEEFTPHFSEIPISIKALGDDIQQKLQGVILSDPPFKNTHAAGSQQNQENGVSFFNKRVTTGAVITLYIIAMSAKHNKSVTIADIFPEKIQLQNYVNGALSIIEATGFKGLNISLVSGSFAVVDIGDLNIDNIIDKAEQRSEPLWISIRKNAYSYFEIDQQDIPAGDDDD